MANMTASVTRMCAECAREFEVKGIGRPPSRCPKCRGETREEPTNGRGKQVVRRARARVSVPESLTSAEPVATGPLDIPAIEAALSGEIEHLEEAIAVRLRLQRALVAFRSVNGRSA